MGWLHAKCEQCWDPIPCTCPAQADRTVMTPPAPQLIHGDWHTWTLSHGWETEAEIVARQRAAAAVLDRARRCRAFVADSQYPWVCQTCGGVDEDHPGYL